MIYLVIIDTKINFVAWQRIFDSLKLFHNL